METFFLCLFAIILIISLLLHVVVIHIFPRITRLNELDRKAQDTLLCYAKEISEGNYGPLQSKIYRKRLPKDTIGIYNSATKQIAVDVQKMNRNEYSIFDFVATAIHEFTHEYQHNVDPKFMKKYDRWNAIVGYDLNPYELQARRNGRRLTPKVFEKYFSEMD